MSEYITTEELIELGCAPREYIESIDSAEPTFIAAQIRSASNKADVYLRKRHKLPFITPSDALKQCVADIATFYCYLKRGFDPSQQDGLIVQLKDEAFALLDKGAKGEVEFDPSGDQTPNLDEHGPLMGNSGNNPYAWLYGNKKNGGGCGCNGKYKYSCC